MDVVRAFNDELRSLLDHKPPISKTKMRLVTKAALRGVKFYKHIVQNVEKFIAKCRPEHKVPGLYVIDSIVRHSRYQFGADRDVFAARFTRNIKTTFAILLSACPPNERPIIVRVLHLWEKNGVFELRVVRYLLEMASRNSINSLSRDPKSPSSGETSSSMRQEHSPANHYGQPNSLPRDGGDSLKFNKNMLDFDYDDDDGEAGETPTEAEPPLSSTLTELEIEQSLNKFNSQAGNHGKLALSQDPVLEHWKRIWKGDGSNGRIATNNSNNYLKTRRSRSRSPSTAALKLRPSHSKQDNPDSTRVSSKKDRVDNQRGSSVSSSRSASERLSDRDRDRDWDRKRDSERDRDRELVRDRKGLPKMRDHHVTVCSSTLWLGHVPKTATEADISDIFGEFGTIISIDLVPPRGCAFVFLDRRQDAMRALRESKQLKLKGNHIKLAWAPSRGLQQHKKLKDFWEADTGASFIPYNKIDEMIDFDRLEEGGVIDEDSLTADMRARRERAAQRKVNDSYKGADIQKSSGLAPSSLEVLKQSLPPPPVSPFNMIPPPPPGMHHPLLIGPPGVMPFPPPDFGTTSSSSRHIVLPPPPMFARHPADDLDLRDYEFCGADQQVGMLLGQNAMPYYGHHVESLAPFLDVNQQNTSMVNERAHHSHPSMHSMIDHESHGAPFDGGPPHARHMRAHHRAMEHLNQGGFFDDPLEPGPGGH